MTKALWNETTVASSDNVALVEFAVYFPRASVAAGVLTPSAAPSTYCHWKGVAKYYDVTVGDQVNEGAAWYYPEPYDDASVVADKIAFWKGIEVEEKPEGKPLVDPGGPKGRREGYEALCWLMVRDQRTSLNAEQIDEQIGLRGDALSSAFEHPHVQMYRQRYKWRLVDGVLEKG